MKKLKNIYDIKFKINLNKEKKEEQRTNFYTLDNVEDREIKQSINTKFKFLKAHQGLQSGHLHVLLGRTNKGKSALVQSLICENIVNGYKTLLFLSEGDKTDVKRRINTVLSIKFKAISKRNEIMNNLVILDESDLTTVNVYEPNSWVSSLFKFVKEFNIQIAYIDNFSTCSFGDSTPDIQAQFVKSLSASTQRYDIPLFGVVHQSKTVSPDKELELEDVRANSAFMNSPSFIYALNNFGKLDPTLRVIKILKSRLDGEIIGKYYQLDYKTKNKEGFYSKDTVLCSEDAKKLFFSNKTGKKYSKTYVKRG